MADGAVQRRFDVGQSMGEGVRDCVVSTVTRVASERLEAFQLFDPTFKMRALLSHPLNSHSSRGERSFYDLFVGRINVDYSLRGSCLGIIVDVFRSCKVVTNPLKLPAKLWLADRLSERIGIAEQ
jgi:hypothetical protein